MRLKNKIILISGAAGFLGSKIVETLLKEQSYCLLIDKNDQKLRKLKNDLKKKNLKILQFLMLISHQKQR